MLICSRICRRFLLGLVILVGCRISMHGQTLAGEGATFDVASVKVNKASTDGRSHIYSASKDGNFKTVNVSMKSLLQVAYSLPETQIYGVTGDVASAMFDIEAKSDAAFDAQLNPLSDDERWALKGKLLQALLADRFKLVCHMETRELPMFEMVVTKDGPKLQPTKENGLAINGGYDRINVQGGTLDRFAQEVAKRIERPVVNKTGVEGRFDLTLRFTPDQGLAMLNGTPIPDPPPDIYTAIREQLGLMLESKKGPVSVLVVDHVEMPSEN